MEDSNNTPILSQILRTGHTRTGLKCLFFFFNQREEALEAKSQIGRMEEKSK